MSREDLDRIIRRAVELQFSRGEGPEESISEDEVLRIGGEVGIESHLVRQAMEEVRAEAMVPLPSRSVTFADRLLGTGQIHLRRVVQGGAQEVEDRLARWLQNRESLRSLRRRAGRSVWEPAEGFAATLRRSFKWQGHSYDLAAATRLDVAVEALEAGYSLVVFSLDVRGIRSEHGWGWIWGLGVGGGTAGVGVGVALLGSVPPLALGIAACTGGIAVGSAVGARIGRSVYARRVERIRLAAEGILDRLERGELGATAG